MSEFHPHAHLDIERLDALLRRALVFNHIGDAMVVAGPDGTITDWNAGAEQLFGWSRAEALGQTPALIHRPEDAPVLWPAIRTAVVRAGRWSGRHAFIRKDGTAGACSAVALPLIDSAGNVWGTLLALTQLDEGAAATETPPAIPRSAEAPLTGERFLIRTLIDAVPDPIFCKDREGRYLLHNAADRTMFFSRSETLFRNALTGETPFRVGGVLPLAEPCAPPTDTPSVGNRVSLLSACRNGVSARGKSFLAPRATGEFAWETTASFTRSQTRFGFRVRHRRDAYR